MEVTLDEVVPEEVTVMVSSDRLQSARLVETTEGQHSDEEYNVQEIEPVLIDRRGYSKSEMRSMQQQSAGAGTSDDLTRTSVASGKSAPRPKYSFRDHMRSGGLLDSKLKPVGFERSQDTPADGNCLIHGKYYVTSEVDIIVKYF